MSGEPSQNGNSNLNAEHVSALAKLARSVAHTAAQNVFVLQVVARSHPQAREALQVLERLHAADSYATAKLGLPQTRDEKLLAFAHAAGLSSTHSAARNLANALADQLSREHGVKPGVLTSVMGAAEKGHNAGRADRKPLRTGPGLQLRPEVLALIPAHRLPAGAVDPARDQSRQR